MLIETVTIDYGSSSKSDILPKTDAKNLINFEKLHSQDCLNFASLKKQTLWIAKDIF